LLVFSRFNIDKCKSVSFCTKHPADTVYHIMDRNKLFRSVFRRCWSPWPRSTCSVLSFEGRCYLLIQIQRK